MTTENPQERAERAEARVKELEAVVANYAELWMFLDGVARFKAAERLTEWKAAEQAAKKGDTQ